MNFIFDTKFSILGGLDPNLGEEITHLKKVKFFFYILAKKTIKLKKKEMFIGAKTIMKQN